METIHCRKCRQAIRVRNFADQMAKIRRHYKLHHPRAFKKSIAKGVKARRKG